MRPHVDEIVLAANHEGGIETLEACADLVDRPIVYELGGSPSGVIGWLVQQGSCDWVLRLDDDEVPSASMLAALPELVADPYPTVYALRRHWLHPHTGEVILTPPWGKDYAYRLIRNMPSLWWFHGLHHTEGSWTGDVRFVDQTLEPADLARGVDWLQNLQELRGQIDVFRDEAAAAREAAAEAERASQAAVRAAQEREALAAEQARAAQASLEALRQTRRYALAQRLARPADLLRRRRRS